MILLILSALINVILIQSKSYEIPQTNSNEFLRSAISFRKKYEESRETTEAKRESCLDEYRQQEKSAHRRPSLSPLCAHYCAETMDCRRNDEQSACVHPSWPSRTIKYVQKFERMCYIRITEVLRYEQADRMCHRYGLQLAIIDNTRLLERLKRMNLFNATCKGQCPIAKGYYIGLKRLLDSSNRTASKWIWSNNVTWTQDGIDCDDDWHTLYPNATLLCYMGNDGQKKVTVWKQGEPNNYRRNIHEAGEQCVEIIASTDNESSFEQMGQFNDISCTKPKLGVICQMEDLKPINSTRFERFAMIVGFNRTETAEDHLLNNLFVNFGGGSIAANLEALTVMLEGLLVLPTFTLDQATNVLNVVDQLVNVTGQIDAESDSLKLVTNKLLHFLDLFPAKIQTEHEGNVSFEYESINMSIVDIQLDQENTEWFSIQEKENAQTIIEINMRVLQKQFTNFTSHRIIEIIFSNFNLFPHINQTHFGIPISYQIANITTIKTDEDLLRFQIRISEVGEILQSSRNLSCAYWSFDEDNGTWITDHTCRFAGFVNDYAQCYCTHFTHFALLMLFEPERTDKSLSIGEELILTFVTYIGMCLSIFGLVMTLITYALFRRSQRNHLHGSLIMLCIALLFVDGLYIPFSLTQSDVSDLKRRIFCTLLAFSFHYFLISSFMWMLIIAIVQYMHFVRIFNTHISNFFTKTCVIGWIIPLIFPSLVIVLGSNGGYTGEFRCWINNQVLLYLTLLIPLSMIMIFNLILFGCILKNIYHRNTIVVAHQRNHSKIQMGTALCCFVSIGCTWLFAWLVLLEPNFLHQLIFCICNSSQGFLIFLFHVYLSKPKRELWRIFFSHKRSEKHSQTSSGQTDLTI